MTEEEAKAWKALLGCYAHPVEALAILRRHLGDDAPPELVAPFEAWAAEAPTKH